MDPIQPDSATPLQDAENGYHRHEADGEVFRGTLIEGKKQGMGSIRLKNGCEFHGMFSQDNFCGKGKFFFEDGASFEGIFDSGNKMLFSWACFASSEQNTVSFGS